MADRDVKIAHAANVLVCTGAMAAADTMLGGAASAIGGYLSWKETRRRAPDRLGRVETEIRTKLQKIVEEVDQNDPRFLLPDMMILAHPSLADVISANRDAETLCNLMLERVSNPRNLPDYRTAAATSAFRMHVTPLIKTLLANRDFTENLTPLFQSAMLQAAEEERNALHIIRDQLGSLTNALNQIETVSRDQLEAIALRFDIERIYDRSDDELRGLLNEKAKDYRKVLAELDDLKGKSAKIDNIHGAARGALEDGNLEIARSLLRDAREIHRQDTLRPALETNAQLMETEATLEMLDGNVEQAYRILCAAADSFAAVDPLEPARRKILGYAEKLMRHGMRFGGAGLPLSVDMMRQTATEDLKAVDVRLWAAGKNAEAIGLRNQGTHTDGPKGADLLAQAVAAYRAALEVYTRADHHVQWAMTQNNLGAALQDQGTRTDGPKGADLLAQAVAAYRAALEVRTRADHPVQWAMTQNNLGGALQDQGTRTDGTKGADLLAQAVAAYCAALEVRTRADRPVQWAITQNNLGTALRNQGSRTDGPKGADLLAQAVAAYRAALEVRTRADHPVQWAMTQNNLGGALGSQGARADGPKGIAFQAEAVATFRASLEVRTRADHPVQWAGTQKNIAITLLDRAQRADAQRPRDDLAAALAAVYGALEVYDPEHTSYEHGSATEVRAAIQTALDALEDEASGA
ncbi:hypothetical protein [Tateyamaria sp.]|uniref:hypothetical protein n=1 Tax=Tateyamaria sp. TaxID=1929288 RepID=UPI0032A0EDCC